MKQAQSLELTPGQIATLVCQLEVSAAKPGNVHRGADFEDATLIDFLNSGVVLGHAIDHDPAASVGEMILRAVQATAWVTDTNTNLGIILLLCPLVGAYRVNKSLTSAELFAVVHSISGKETELIFEAIGGAQAGGLGGSDQFDVNDPTATAHDLVAAMKFAQERDMIAKQYCNGFADVIDFVLPAIEQGQQRLGSLTPAIIYAHVKTMAQWPDSLIARKLGDQTAIASAGYAGRAIDQFEGCGQDFEPFWKAVGDLDFWLRSDHHRRNPGTTADLVTAALFVGVATDRLVPPFR